MPASRTKQVTENILAHSFFKSQLHLSLLTLPYNVRYNIPNATRDDARTNRMRAIGQVKVSTWRFFTMEYAYTLHRNHQELEEAADKLRAEGWTVKVSEF